MRINTYTVYVEINSEMHAAAKAQLIKSRVWDSIGVAPLGMESSSIRQALAEGIADRLAAAQNTEALATTAQGIKDEQAQAFNSVTRDLVSKIVNAYVGAVNVLSTHASGLGSSKGKTI